MVLANGAQQTTLDIRLKSSPSYRAVSETFGLGLDWRCVMMIGTEVHLGFSLISKLILKRC
jgi:hypothetical protein